MRCRERSIEVRAFDGVHVIGLDARVGPVQYSMTPLPKPDVAASAEWAAAGNLGMGSRARGTRQVERVPLATDAHGRDYFLEMTPVLIDMCTIEITSRVVQRDSAGRELAAHPILKDRFPLECGD
jgi:hypothetical protein